MSSNEIEKLTNALYAWEDGLSHLGNCIVQFQRIESVLSCCMAVMVGADEKIGKIVTCEMSFRAKVAVFRALFIHHYQKAQLPDDIIDLISRINWAEQERNSLVHSLWDATDEYPDSIKRQKTMCRKIGLVTDNEHLLANDLDDLSKLYEGISTDILYLTNMHLPNLDFVYSP